MRLARTRRIESARHAGIMPSTLKRSRRSDGSPMYVKASGKPVFDAEGEFRGYRGTGTDVTALRTAEAEARESERRYREAQLELTHANRLTTMGELAASI